jgi:hypothetical protein
MRPFRTSGWATGEVAIIALGDVAPALLKDLDSRIPG